MFRISKEFTFSASHVLNGLPEGHQCGRLHGHNYRVRFTLAAENLNEVGFVRDYGELNPIKQYLDNTFDHRHLNDVLFQPSAESIAAFLFHKFVSLYPELVEVAVSETEKTWATYGD